MSIRTPTGPVFWRCYYVKRGNHVHCRLFAGPAEGALGLIGNLTFRHAEFTQFTAIRRSLPIDFRTEERPGGGPDGDLDCEFAALTY